MLNRYEWRQTWTAVMVAFATAALSVGAWLAWLGFHAEYKTAPGGSTQTGPYEPWQVIGLALTLVVGVFVAGWVGSPAASAVGGVGGLAFIASYDWGTHPNSDGLWVIGVTLLLIGASAAGFLIARLASRLRRPGQSG